MGRVHTNQRGFTIIELLVVIVILGGLLAIAMFFGRPQDYTVANRDTERQVEVAQLAQALHRYIDATQHMPESIPSDKAINIGSDDDESALCALLVPTYLKDIPYDPVVGTQLDDKDCRDAFFYTTGYSIQQRDGREFTVSAPAAETGKKIEVTVRPYDQ